MLIFILSPPSIPLGDKLEVSKTSSLIGAPFETVTSLTPATEENSYSLKFGNYYHPHQNQKVLKIIFSFLNPTS